MILFACHIKNDIVCLHVCVIGNDLVYLFVCLKVVLFVCVNENDVD